MTGEARRELPCASGGSTGWVEAVSLSSQAGTSSGTPIKSPSAVAEEAVPVEEDAAEAIAGLGAPWPKAPEAAAEQPATQPAGDAEQPAEATPEQPQQQQEEPQEEKSIEERLEEEAIRAGTGLLRDLLNSRRSQ